MARRIERNPSSYSEPYGPSLERLGGGGLTPSRVEYTPPAYSEAKVKAYQQEALAPGISGLRRAMREVQAGRYTSPSARRETLRGAMRGFGEALAPLQVGASEQARRRYDIQYQQDVLAEKLRVGAGERAEEREYREGLRREAEAERQEADRVIVGYRAGGAPIYMSRQEADSYFATTEAERGVPSQIVGLDAANLRPIRPITTEPVPTYTGPPSAAPGPAYPENWMV